jgi:hypothetical protein
LLVIGLGGHIHYFLCLSVVRLWLFLYLRHLERGDDHLSYAPGSVLHAGDGTLYEGQHSHDQK